MTETATATATSQSSSDGIATSLLGAEATTTEATTTTATTEATTATTEQAAWVPEAYKDHEALKEFSTADALIQDYLQLRETLASNPDQFPGFDAPYEDNRAFFEKIGVPETPDKYVLEALKDVPEEQINKPLVEAIAKAAHEKRMPASMLDHIVKAFNENQKAHEATLLEQTAAELKEMETALVKEWGQAKDANLAAADKALSKFGTPEMKELLRENQHVFLDPTFQKFLISVGQAITESAGPGASSTSGGLISSADQASAELKRFMMDENNRKAYRSPIHPNHGKVLEYVTALYQRGAKLHG